MIKFKIIPYIGANQIKFNSNMQHVAKLIGNPLAQKITRRGEPVHCYENLSLVFSKNDELQEISFTGKAHAELMHIDLLWDGDALEKLIKIHGNPLEYLDILFFPNIGLSLSGFHTDEPKVATAIAPHRFDGVLSKFKPYTYNKSK